MEGCIFIMCRSIVFLGISCPCHASLVRNTPFTAQPKLRSSANNHSVVCTGVNSLVSRLYTNSVGAGG